MDVELPYGPWTKLLTAQWKDYPLQIHENPEHVLLVLLFEKKDNEVSGVLVLQRKPYFLEGDLSKVMLAQKRDLTFIEKRTKGGSQQYVLVDATPAFIPYSQEALEQEIVKQYGELESVGKILKKMLEESGHVKVREARKLEESEVQPLLGDPLSLLALLQGRVVLPAEPEVRGPLGTDLHKQIVDVPLRQMRGTRIVGGTHEKRLHVLHLLLENALMNHTPCLVFDSEEAFGGLAVPNAEAEGLDRFGRSKPVGFTMKDYRLGKSLFIDLELVDAGLFLSAFGLEKANAAPLIQSTFEDKRAKTASLADLAMEVSKTPPTQETPAFLINRAARVLGVIQKGYADVFAKNTSEEVVTPWKEEVGKVIRVNLAGQRPEIQQLAMFSLLKGILASSPHGFTLLVAFEPDASQLHERTLRIVKELYQQGLGYVVHDGHESGFEQLEKGSLYVELVGNDVIIGEGDAPKRRLVLRPSFSQCTEFAASLHAPK